MARTPEQKAADEQLDKAIQHALGVHGLATGVVSEYVVLVAMHSFEDDGDQSTNIARLVSGDSIPHYRVLGLLDFAATCYRADIAASPDEFGV